eukprot:Lankesteria_metandrocarpae@DN3683_c0_g1_i1.p1
MQKLGIAVFDAKPYDRLYLQESNEKFGFTLKFFSVQLSLDSVQLAKGCEAICVFVNDHADAAVLSEAANLGVKLLLLRCAGYDKVDLEAALVLGISVCRVPAYSPEGVAEFAVALLMTLNRKTHIAYNRVRDGNFSLVGLDGFNFHGKTVGVVGTGKIGQCFINIMIGFGCNILAYDVCINKEYAAKPQVKYVELEQLFSESDIVSLHLPLLDSTRYIVSEELLGLMSPSALLVNTSRGGLVDAKALVNALKTQKLGGAALDVYEEEEGYFFEDRSAEVILDDTLARLQNMRNCIITSHQAFFTREALIGIADVTLANAIEYTQGKRMAALSNYIAPPVMEERALRSMMTRGMTMGVERDSILSRFIQ